MQPWEYKIVECIHYLEDWYPAFENGAEIPNWKGGGNAGVYCNTLGEQGWELVNFCASAAATHGEYREFFYLAFKRPKP